jgi:hypothetical protein
MSAAEIYEGINQVSIRPNYLNKVNFFKKKNLIYLLS